MSKAYVIEIDEEAAGLVTAEKDGFRFFAATRAYHALEGVLFRTPREAERAARLRRYGAPRPETQRSKS